MEIGNEMRRLLLSELISDPITKNFDEFLFLSLRLARLL